MSPAEKELCVKYPWLPRCRKNAENLTINQIFSDQKYVPIVERAFERLEQALTSGKVSKRKIPSVITVDEYNFHLQNSLTLNDTAEESINMLTSVYNGKTKVIKP